MQRLAIIIPAHNEEKRITRTLDAYILYFAKLEKQRILQSKIIVVLNACSDNTASIVKKYKKKIDVLEFKQGGKGFAVIEGFKHAIKKPYTHIGFVDADMSTMPEEFFRLLSKVEKNDGVIASRYLPGAKLTPPNTPARVLASRAYNSFIRALLLIPYRDTQCGAKIFKAAAIKQIISLLGMTSWAFDIELLYIMYKKGFKIKEVPTAWSNREYSKINFWGSGMWMGFAIIRLRIIKSPFKRMVRIYDRFIRIFKPAK